MCALRSARGPNRAPGRYDVPPSQGAPTTAASGFHSSSCSARTGTAGARRCRARCRRNPRAARACRAAASPSPDPCPHPGVRRPAHALFGQCVDGRPGAESVDASRAPTPAAAEEEQRVAQVGAVRRFRAGRPDEVGVAQVGAAQVRTDEQGNRSDAPRRSAPRRSRPTRSAPGGRGPVPARCSSLARSSSGLNRRAARRRSPAR